MDTQYVSATILRGIDDSLRLKQDLLRDPKLLATVHDAAIEILECFKRGGKVLFCGNGGSAADAQHLAAEFSGRYYFDRGALPSEALHVNTSYLTAVGNDYSFAEVYARLVRGIGVKGDVLVALSSSGNSQNVVEAMSAARSLGMKTVGFTGAGGGLMKEWCDYHIEIPSKDTPRVQECQMLLGHLICEVVESLYFSPGGG